MFGKLMRKCIQNAATVCDESHSGVYGTASCNHYSGHLHFSQVLKTSDSYEMYCERIFVMRALLGERGSRVITSSANVSGTFSSDGWSYRFSSLGDFYLNQNGKFVT